MTPWEVCKHFGLHLFWPPTLLRYTWDMIYVSALGHGVHPYQYEDCPKHPGKSILNFRPATTLGLVYLALMCASSAIWDWLGRAGAGRGAPRVLGPGNRRVALARAIFLLLETAADLFGSRNERAAALDS